MLTPWSAVPIAALCSNILVAVYALTADPRHPANRLLGILCGTLIWWAIFNVLHLTLTDPTAVNIVIRVSAPAWVWCAPLALHLVLVVLRDRPLLRDHPTYVLAYAAGVPFILLRWFTGLLYTDTPAQMTWGYQQVPGPLFPAYAAYMMTFNLTAIGLVLRRLARARAGLERKRMACLALGVAIPLVGGTITNLVLPLVGIRVFYSALGLTTFTALFFAVGIVRYRLFRPSLRRQAREILRRMSQPVLLVDHKGGIVEANEAAGVVTERRSADLVGTTIGGLFRGGEAAWQRLMAERDADGHVGNHEMEWRNSSGDSVSVLVSLTTVRDRTDQHDAYLLLATDYSDLKRAELALRDSEELYRRLHEHSLQGIALVSDRRVIRVNPQVCEILGYAEEELLDRPVPDFWPERQADGTRSLERGRAIETAVEAGEPQFFLWQWRHKDGRIVDTEMSMHTITVHGERLIQTTMRDVTAQRRLQDAIEHLHLATAHAVGEAFFTTLVQHLAESLGMSHAHVGEIRSEQPGYLHVLAVWEHGRLGTPGTIALAGTPCETVLDKNFFLQRSGVMEAYPTHERVQELGVESYAGMKLVDPDGEVIGVLSAFSEQPFSPPFPQVDSLFSLFASRASAEILRLRTEEHERRHAEELRDLQKMESIALLAGGVAHDFNNILVGVLGHASLAREMLPADAPVQKSLEIVEQSAERAVGLTTQLLAYARGGKHDPVPLDLGEVVVDLLQMLGAVLPKSVTVECDLESRLPAVLADSSQMQQLIMNLCTNAGEAMGETGGTLTVRTVREHGGGHCADCGRQRWIDEVVLTVADTGCGIDDATRQRIFEPFFSTKAFGRGLGLAAAQGIVLNHNGCLHFTSRLGEGTVFRLSLPAHGRAAEAASPDAMACAAGNGSGTVLLVDDEATVCRFVKEALERLGYSVLTATDGNAAIKVYRQHAARIVLVLLDMLMPGRNGLETLQALREINPQVKVILSSGYSEDLLPSPLRKARPNAFLKKPYRSRTLATTVTQVLSA